jgi:hypothetical protein
MKTSTTTKIKYLFIPVIAIAGILVSCKKFVEIPPAPNLIQSNTVFSSDETALSAVAGLYIQMRGNSNYFTNGGMSMYAALSADELTTSNPLYLPFLNNDLLPGTSALQSDFWQVGYRNIYTANAILEGLAQSRVITAELKTQLTGEIKVIRAFNYFYLINLFNDVPLILTTDYQANAPTPRSPVEQIYNQILSDLSDAKGLLPSAYPSSGRARPNKFTAAALLSRVFLYRNDWMNAEIQASEVINSGLYSLSQDLNSVFLVSSNETIWQIPSPNDFLNTDQGSMFLPIPIPLPIIPDFYLTNNLLDSFEPGDQRKMNWINVKNVNSFNYYYPYKYKERQNSTPVKEYNIIFRLGELFLIRAEARAMQDDFSGSQSDVNAIRNRAALPNTNAASQSELLSAIRKERQLELFTEWGDRWLDLKRTDQLTTTLLPVKAGNWQPIDSLYPIPATEINYNPFLTQNPGY